MRMFMPFVFLLVTACGERSHHAFPLDPATDAEESPTEETPDVADSADASMLEEHASLAPFAPTTFAITSVKWSGNGCPQGTVSHLISPDRMAFTLLLDEFSVVLDPAARRRGVEAHCVIQVSFSAPRDWSFGILGAETRGFADLDAKARGREKLAVLTNRRMFKTVHQSKFKGPLSDNFQSSTEIPLKAALWTPCNRKEKKLVLRSSLYLEARRGAGGLISVDSFDGAASQHYQLGWRRCRTD